MLDEGLEEKSIPGKGELLARTRLASRQRPLFSVLVPRQGEGLRAGSDGRGGPTVEQRGPVTGGGGRVLPVTGQPRAPPGSGTGSTDPYPDADAYAAGRGDHPLAADPSRLDRAPPVLLDLLVRRAPVLVVHQIGWVRGGRRRGRRQGRRGGGPRPGSLLRPQLIVALLAAGHCAARRSHLRHHLASATQRAPGTSQGAARIPRYSVVMGARRSPRFASDLGPGRRVHVGLRAARRVRVSLAGRRQRVLARRQGAAAHGRGPRPDGAARRRHRGAVHAERVPAQAVTAAVLPRLQPQGGDAARGHHGAALRGRRCPVVRRVHGRPVRVVRRGWCRVRTRGPRRRDRRTGHPQPGTHPGQHGGGRLADRHGHPAHVVPGDGRRRCVETVHGADLGVVVVVRRRRDHRAQGVHPGEAFAAQRRGHLGRPIVVRAVRAVEGVRVCERLADEAVQTGAETGLEVHRVRGGVRVARLLPPLRPPIFEPYLKQESYRRSCFSIVELFVYFNRGKYSRITEIGISDGEESRRISAGNISKYNN